MADLESLSNDIREAYIADGGRKRDLPTTWLSDFIANRILAQEVSFATLSSDLLRKFSKFLENEHKFVVEGKDGKPCIKDPLYKKAYKSVPECRFPKQRGQNSIIGTMSRFHTFVRWSIKRGHMNRDP